MTTTTAHIPADPNVVFATITDIARLPDWNDAIVRVVDSPTNLADGAQWVVELHALGQHWNSRSTVAHLDPEARRFGHRSQTDDGNPSWVDWHWSIDDGPDGGAEVTVAWELHPVTFWRRVLFSHIRRRQLARTEVPASLAALAAHVVTP